MKNKKVYIIIINYNGYQFTRDCIDSIFNISYNSYEIILVDNASTDDSLKKLQNDFLNNKKVVILTSERNLGFAGGNNLGISYALEKGGEYFLMLNNDTIVKSDFLDIMIDNCYEDTVICPLIYYYDNPKEVWYSAGKFNKNKCIVENGNPEKKSEVNFATGCCMLISKNIIEKVGFMDESFFMYCEDTDYSLRIIENGCRIIYTPKAVIYHKVGKSSGGLNSKLSIYYNNRNRFYLIRDHKLGKVCVVYTITTRLIRICFSFFIKNNDYMIIQAYKDFKNGIKGQKIDICKG